MSNKQLSQETIVLIEGKAWIEDEENWCQHEYEDKHGKLCAVGALGDMSLYGLDAAEANACNLLSLAAEELFETCLPTYVNDNLGFKAVHQMYDRAITLSMRSKNRNAPTNKR